MIRLSCAGFVILRDENGRYCLLVNENQLKRHGKKVLSPIGGGIAADQRGLDYLRSIGAVDFERDNDLRFKLPKRQLRKLKKWFVQRVDRELSPAREVEEELVDETKVLTKEDLEGMIVSFSGFAKHRGNSTHHSGANPIPTVRLAEIFTVTLSETAMDKLLSSSEGWIYFVTEKEIRAGVTADGIDIADVCKTILRPKRSIRMV
jgi:hypothetical protein